MATVNINSGVSDDFYRYKMPKLLAKVEGKGNGIKTVIVNMVEIAKALHRPPAYPTKFFGCELGAQTQMDMKNERYIVNGAHDSAKLQSLLDGFIKRFVLCTECGNPETNLEINKKGNISQTCIACGHHSMVDMRHKLTTFILKNPPTGGAPTPTKREAKKTRREGKKNGDEGGAATTPVKASKTLSTETPAAAAPTEDEDWSVDTSAAAVRERQRDLTSAAASLAVNDDLELPIGRRLEKFFAFVQAEKKKGALTPACKTVFEEAKRLDVVDKGAGIVGEILFTEQVASQAKEYTRMLLQFVFENKKAQRNILVVVEHLFGQHSSLKVAIVLKTFYDLDLIEEDIFIDWHAKAKKSDKTSVATREKAAPFITWLKEAEEETDSEDEVDLVFTHKSKEQVQRESQPQKEEAEVADDDDDFDIDAI